jgi:predicted TIM-barrel fold metal-dependent hydrolase
MTNSDEPIVVVSADCHAGNSIKGYKQYLEKKYWDDFDAWAESFENPFADLDEIYADRNWDSAKRLHDLEVDGIVAEVIFPNTVPPFYPTNGLVAGPPKKEDYELRWAGLRAHNRWLVDFCADAPGRRAGIAQLMFNNPADAIAEIAWARENGLTGGVLIPSIPPGAPIPPVWDRDYDAVWAACQDMDVPINHHGGSGSPDYGWTSGMARVLYITEFTFYSGRSVWHLAWAGVFERFPKLRYVITEQGYGGTLSEMDMQDGFYHMMKNPGDLAMAQGAAELVGDYIDTLPMSPGEYVKRNCWIGASFMNSWEVSQRERVGVDKIMWGCDYPHTEATWPHSRESIAEAVAGIPADEARKMFGLNAVEFYGFDMAVLGPAVEKFGPRPSEILTPVAVDA